ncbi:MAG: Ankyrin [Chthonomonadaceae bacterium]|nr:Ankyrin [Chthonomonadaceae bacterium]
MKSSTLRRVVLGLGGYSVGLGLIVGGLMLMRPPPPKNPAASRRLVQAILHNDTAEVKAALKAGADPNDEMEGSSWSDLVHPITNAMKGDRDQHLYDTALLLTMDCLVKRDPKAVNPQNKDIPLENLATVKALVEAGADVNARNRIGNTPLAMAVSWGYDDTAHFLLEHKANPNLALDGGSTPCSDAAAGGDPKLVKDLLLHGANPNAIDILGMTPLFMAALPPETPQQVEIVKLLLQFHADRSVKDKTGMTALAHAQKDNRTGIAKLLQQTGAQPHVPSP